MRLPGFVAVVLISVATEGNVPAASSGIAARNDALGVHFLEPVDAEIITSDLLDFTYRLSTRSPPAFGIVRRHMVLYGTEFG